MLLIYLVFSLQNQLEPFCSFSEVFHHVSEIKTEQSLEGLINSFRFKCLNLPKTNVLLKNTCNHSFSWRSYSSFVKLKRLRTETVLFIFYSTECWFLVLKSSKPCIRPGLVVLDFSTVFISNLKSVFLSYPFSSCLLRPDISFSLLLLLSMD